MHAGKLHLHVVVSIIISLRLMILLMVVIVAITNSYELGQNFVVGIHYTGIHKMMQIPRTLLILTTHSYCKDLVLVLP